MQLQQNSHQRVLLLYNSLQTYTSAIFEHVSSFVKYSDYRWLHMDYVDLNSDKINLSCFDIVVIHYSVRLPFGQLSDFIIQKLKAFQGLKVLFVQDEYDHVNKTKTIMLDVKFHLIFTVVPNKSISLVYPPDEFASMNLINNLTGYVPDNLSSKFNAHTPPSKRSCVIAYRGRQLPTQYGRLGQEKTEIAKRVKAYCRLHNIKHDIAYKDKDRIYGDAWYQFICSSKAMLGSESGSNVFDWDGNLKNSIDQYKKQNPTSHEQEVYDKIVAPKELDGMMNQISPRVFEMIAGRTAMILFEGNYSEVLTPHRHYIPLKKDFSNLDEVFFLINDDDYIDDLVDNVYEDIINSKKYSYQTFVKMVDQQIDIALRNFSVSPATNNIDICITTFSKVCLFPIRAKAAANSSIFYNSVLTLYKLLMSIIPRKILNYVPKSIRVRIKRLLKRTLSLL